MENAQVAAVFLAEKNTQNIQNIQNDQSWNRRRQKKDQSWNRRRQKNRENKSYSIARLARDATLSAKTGFSPLSVSIDLESFKETFFNQKHLLEYSRLKPLSKLLVCQYVLHNQDNNNLKSIPFTYRLPTELHGCNGSELSKRIQRKLKAALKRAPLFWMTRESNDGLDKTITHVHGEILLYPDEQKKCKQALVDLFRYYNPKLAPNKPVYGPVYEADKAIIRNQLEVMLGFKLTKNKPVDDGTIMPKPMAANKIIVFSSHSRDKLTAQYGKFYGVFVSAL